MFLAIDIGNTNITFGVFQKNSLVYKDKVLINKSLSLEDYEILFKNKLSMYKIKSCVIGSVVSELNIIIKKVCDNIFNIDSYIINRDSFIDIKVDVKEPLLVGLDRIANAVIAKNKYTLPVIVIDIGTAITFDIVSKEGNFIGGVIMPGINTQLNSLYENTSALPKIEVINPVKAIGDSTENAMLSGVVLGTSAAIDGLTAKCEKELGVRATLILTGGGCDFVLNHLIRAVDYVDKDLTLKGYKMLYDLNN